MKPLRPLVTALAIPALLVGLSPPPAAIAQQPSLPPTQPTQQEPPPRPREDGAEGSTTGVETEPHFVRLHYPRDKEYVVALVDGLPIWLEHLVQHIDERHYPGFARMMAGPDDSGSPEGDRILASDLIAPWVRQLADIHALEAEAKQRGSVDDKAVEDAISAALKAAFEQYLADYTRNLGEQGLPTELSQKRVNLLLSDYQMRLGLASELQGWIDYLEPHRTWTNQQLNDYFQSHARYFGGGVTVDHILIQNRDAGTGILLEQAGRIRAASRLAEVQQRLQKDGSNFQDLARRYSDDTRTGLQGGRLEYIERFDQRMPTALCRAAWQLKDGEVSDAIETQYGWHIVRRVEHVQHMYMLFSEEKLPLVGQALQRELQEDLLFRVRAAHKIELRL